MGILSEKQLRNWCEMKIVVVLVLSGIEVEVVAVKQRILLVSDT